MGDIGGGYKAGVIRAARAIGILEDGLALWQVHCHDHTIRSHAELARLPDDVANNPAQCEADTYFRFRSPDIDTPSEN